MTLGSLFDGIGGFPLAGVMCGITPVWASEIEPFPMKVTAARFPQMKQLGSVTEINGAEIEPVDIITFGSPCQDLSVAGKQLGIHEGQRSNLFFEAIRIIKEMRDADRTNGRSGVDIRPRFAVWENVPGAFSSNKGEDFRAVLKAFASVCQEGLDIPRPPRGKWNHAGAVVGDGWSVAWRVYDAQYWGVPQRRKRIYLIADFASERAGEILFERESVCGDSAEGRAAREETAADAERSIGGSCLFEPRSLMEENWAAQDAKNALRANASKSWHCVVEHAMCYPINTMVATRGGKDDMRTCFGVGEPGDPQFTISAAHEHAVCYPTTARTLTAERDGSWCPDKGPNVVCYGVDCRNGVLDKEKTHTIQAKANGGQSLNCTPSVCYRNSGYGGMTEGVGTLRANGGDVGGGTESIVVSAFTKGRRARDKNDYETWMCGMAANTLNTFENSDVRATTVVVRRNDE